MQNQGIESLRRYFPEPEVVEKRNADMPVASNAVGRHGERLTKICADYVTLVDVCSRLIRVHHNAVLNEAQEPLIERIRMMREHHGPHPANPSFVTFLCLSLNYLRFKVSLLLLHSYIPGQLHPEMVDDEPDLLVMLTETLTTRDTSYVNPRLLAKTVEELHGRYFDVNRWSVYHESCLLNAVITKMDPDLILIRELEPGKLSAFFEKAFKVLVERPDIDFDLKAASRKYPKIRMQRPLEVALRGGQYRAAIAMISRCANVHLVDIKGCHFMTGASLAFMYMALAGFRFPSLEELRMKLSVDEDEEEYLMAFLRWLQVHMNASKSLANMSAVNLKASVPAIAHQLCHDLILPEELSELMLSMPKGQLPTRVDCRSKRAVKKKRIGQQA